jgi:DNA repair protein RecO (recombination protein O)
VSESRPIPLDERLYRTEAIVLHRMDYGEADRIVTVFTPGRGKVRIIAKGARKPLSRLGPHLDYFFRCRLLLAKGRELDVVSDAATVDAHEGIRTDLEAFGHASHLVEVLNRLTEDRQENEAAFDLLASSLRLLSDGVDPWLVTRHYEWALLAILGHRPELYRCVACGNELLAATNAWSSRLGGALCPLCRGADGGSRPVSINAQKVVRLLDRQGLAAAARLSLDDDLRGEIEGLMADYLRHLAERDLSSLRVSRAILQDAGSA